MERLVGIPYVQHGRSYDGADCWGIVFLYYRDILGRSIPSYVAEMEAREFRPRGIGPLISEERDRAWSEVSAPIAGDVVLMRTGIHHNHVGIYLAGRTTLHSEGPGLSAIERLDALHLRNRVSGFYRLLEC
jgi:cell wall-associated NlpC family hydrolase